MLPNELLLGRFKNSNERTPTLFTFWGVSTSWELVAVFINSSHFSRTFPSGRNLRALQGLWVVTGNSETEKLEEKSQGTEMRSADKERQERHVQSQA